jgi:hypothetical protein
LEDIAAFEAACLHKGEPVLKELAAAQ